MGIYYGIFASFAVVFHGVLAFALVFFAFFPISFLRFNNRQWHKNTFDVFFSFGCCFAFNVIGFFFNFSFLITTEQMFKKNKKKDESFTLCQSNSKWSNVFILTPSHFLIRCFHVRCWFSNEIQFNWLWFSFLFIFCWPRI